MCVCRGVAARISPVSPMLARPPAPPAPPVRSSVARAIGNLTLSWASTRTQIHAPLGFPPGVDRPRVITIAISCSARAEIKGGAVWRWRRDYLYRGDIQTYHHPRFPIHLQCVLCLTGFDAYVVPPGDLFRLQRAGAYGGGARGPLCSRARATVAVRAPPPLPLLKFVVI